MKKIFLFYFIALSPVLAVAQDSINPYSIHQACNIVLQNTDVYYNPFLPPAPTDIRAYLSNQSAILRDSDGLANIWDYQPFTHGTVLWNWHPCGPTPLGATAVWQRLFTAKRKPDGTPSDIIAGGGAPGTRVTVSANEDVDFRASGRIKLKSGFHVKPGAFFHAYTEPKFYTLVFSDEFDSTALDRSKWYVGRGHGEVNGGAECSNDSNVMVVTDTGVNGAHDGHALDIILREDTGGCNCNEFGLTFSDNCTGIIDTALTHKFLFSTACLRACPWPFASQGSVLGGPAFAHMPYGKYEVREKIPHTPHHANNWGYGDYEWDMNEIWGGDMSIIHPNINGNFKYGPYKGMFGPRSGIDTTPVFWTSSPDWSMTNYPTQLVLANTILPVYFHVDTPLHPHSFYLSAAGTTQLSGGFPLSLSSNRTDSMVFYYQRSNTNRTEPLPWRVDTDSHGTRRIFSGGYRDSSGILLRFSKAYQPTSITLKNPLTLVPKAYACHWEYNLNYPNDSGKLYLDDTVPHGGLYISTDTIWYTVTEGGGYLMAPEAFNGNDTTGGYEYHTFTMEFLPHELRYLVDGNVMRRVPDRLIPVNDKHYDWVTKMGRTQININPSEVDLDIGSYKDSLGISHDDSTGVHPGTVGYMERQFFESHDTESVMGFKDVTIGGKTYHAAHHLIDYVKVWDVPADIKIPNYPQ